MQYQQTTQTPNELFDIHLPQLTFSELKILLYIIRQTYGWTYKNGKRKKRDRITYKQLHHKTGVSIRSIPSTIQSLVTKHHIQITNYQGDLLHTPDTRKGKVCIYYAPCFESYAKNNTKVCKKVPQDVQNSRYNKTKETKLIGQKNFQHNPSRMSDIQRLQEILANRNA
ncbi:hypothetical protein IMCC3317_34440 [Kordia antarctica]|uniref:Bacteriophage lambda Replication protein O N-terminal domain-containing protein n=1 Tax=Kordia antarctica TaxID=1218801 RepID=A0A7L4ZNI8_9FLAO|nr:replication protein [Kordia antarctica]QHI38060.1 hypothetical protein IMCC3317_34440 [Kordia antarctica]